MIFPLLLTYTYNIHYWILTKIHVFGAHTSNRRAIPSPALVHERNYRAARKVLMTVIKEIHCNCKKKWLLKMLDQWCLSKINLNTRLEFKISAFESLTVYRFQYLSDRLSLDDFSNCLEFHYPTQGTTKVLSISPGPVERPQGCALAEPSGPLLAPNFCSRATRKS